MIKKKRSSPIWDHFVAADKQMAKCNYCSMLISNKQGNTTNMTNHLRNKHLTFYLKLNAEKDARASSVNEEDDEGTVEEDGLLADIEVRSPSPSASSVSVTGDTSVQRSSSRLSDNGDSAVASASSGTASAVFSPPPSPAGSKRQLSRSRSATPTSGQGTLENFRLCDTKTTEKLNYAVTFYIVTCNRPLNTVEKQGFKDMLQAFKPGYRVLSRRALSDKYIPRLYEQVKSQLKELLKEANAYSLTSDNWTSSAMVPFTSMTAHYFDKLWENLYAVTLACRATHVAHTGINLRDFFEDALRSWSLSIEMCVALTTDNASDMRLAADLLNVPHMRCIGHTIQNGVTDILKSDLVKKVVKESKELLQWASMARVWTAYSAWVTKNHNGGEAKKLPTTSPTRWWTELKLFEQIVESHDLLRQFAAAFERGKCLKNIPGPRTMFVLRKVIKALKPIELICTNLSADNYVTASAVLPVLHLLEAGFEDDDAGMEPEEQQEMRELEEEDANDLNFDLEALVENMKPSALREPIIRKLRKRYAPEPLAEEDLELLTPQLAAQARIDHRCAVKCHDLLTKVSFLDPRYKEELTKTERERAKEQLKSEFREGRDGAANGGNDSSQTEAEAVSLSLTKKPSLASLFAKRRKTDTDGGDVHGAASTSADTPEQAFLQELGRYDSVPPLNMDVDVRLWWKERVDAYPRLSLMARKYLCVMASSTPSERLFSTSGNVITDTRTCLGDELSETLIFLSTNKSFIKKP